MRIAHGVLILAGMLAACVDDPVTGPPIATELQVVSGGGQQGTPGYRLENEVVVRLLDEHGAGVVGAEITFRSDDPYTVPEPATAVTDSTGVARTWWRLGSTLGPQELVARFEDRIVVRAQATASSMDVRNATGRLAALCVLDSAGTLSCGRGPSLGAPNPAPRVVAPSTLRFTEVVVYDRGCAVAESGRVWCFTLSTSSSALYSSFEELPGTYPPLHGLSSSTLGQVGYCGLSAVGRGYCWGVNTDNRFAQVPLVNPTTPTAISTTQPFASILVGPYSSCGLTAEGAAWCWGYNGSGLAGQPPTTPLTNAQPAELVTALKFSQLVFTGFPAAACGIATSGGLWCWGQDPVYPFASGHLPRMLSGFASTLDAKLTGRRFTSFLQQPGARSFPANEEYDRVVLRRDDFGGYPLRNLLPGPTVDVACAVPVGTAGALCRSITEAIRPVAIFSLGPVGVGLFGIPPQ
ncbi:MAG: hypothetical protein SFU84_00020 [Gemmatimonadales bacterium]|nr:hypothetical protein [Gemmatimonadales bacterium]